jgi:hypothetical protein
MTDRPLPPENEAEMLDSIAKLMDQTEKLKETLFTVMAQADSDLASAHAEICKLQNLDPTKHTWPRWTPQANSIRWHSSLREQFGLLALSNGDGQ